VKYFVVTLFPELVAGFCREGLVAKAAAEGRIAVDTITPRDFTHDKHRTCDDTPYGGGNGMVMMPGPLVDAMEEADRRSAVKPRRIFLTPQGALFDQAKAHDLLRYEALTLVCGRYEGIDERAVKLVDEELSLGDFVLMGGEIAALAVIEATARLVPGVLGNPESIVEESHSRGLLEYPQYTRPAVFRGEGVPDVLISGHHDRIAKWRRREAFKRTLERRPDLLEGRALSEEESAWLEELRRG
jgi:tRNA (guanine37-N1)-methyltransferase